MSAFWVLPRKVAKMVLISIQSSFEGYYGCFLLHMYYLVATERSTQEAHMAASWVLPFGTSSMGHSVCSFTKFEINHEI